MAVITNHQNYINCCMCLTAFNVAKVVMNQIQGQIHDMLLPIEQVLHSNDVMVEMCCLKN